MLGDSPEYTIEALVIICLVAVLLKIIFNLKRESRELSKRQIAFEKNTNDRICKCCADVKVTEIIGLRELVQEDIELVAFRINEIKSSNL